jgi:rhamnogalacturonan endolyase
MKRITFLILVIFSIAMAKAQRVTDQFDRGVVAIHKGNNQVFISWRFLATDPDDIAFNIYRQVGSAEAVKLNPNPVTGATNFLWDFRVDFIQ